MSNINSPLDGTKILDFSRVLSGPFATMTLADLGADVVKVERAGSGDDTRRFGPPFNEGVSTYFLSVNRGKRSITLDLKNPDDVATAKSLAMKADVVIENFRPGVMGRLGLGAESLRASKPSLIFCSISGFGQEAGAKPGYDLVVQGLSGIPSLTGSQDSPPYKCGASVADLVAGMNATQAILAALVRRERTGDGATLDVSMLAGQQALLTYHASANLNGGKEPTRIGNAHPSIHPFCALEANDGFINVAVGNDRLWTTFCEVIEASELVDHPSFATNPLRVENREALNQKLAPIFIKRSVDEWNTALGKAGVPAGPIRTVAQSLADADLCEHPHPSDPTLPSIRTVARPYKIDNVPDAAELRAPNLGEHSEEVLQDWLE